MPRLTPSAAHEIAMVSSTPDGSGFPIGLMPGALPSDHASRQTLNTTAVRLPLGHTQFALVMPRRAPRFSGAPSYQVLIGWAKAREAGAHVIRSGRRLCPPYGFMIGTPRSYRIDRNGQCQSCRCA